MVIKKKKKIIHGFDKNYIVTTKVILYLYVHCHKWLHIAQGWKVMYYGLDGETLQIENIIINGESINQRFTGMAHGILRYNI